MSKDMMPVKETVTLWGREFNIVKTGIAEQQIVDFVNQIINERDLLLQRQEHLTALNKLAERTVTEAEKLAEEIKREAKDRASADSAKMLAEVKDEYSRLLITAQDESAKIIAEGKDESSRILTGAKDESARIVTSAKDESAKMMAEAETNSKQIFEKNRAEILDRANEEIKVMKSDAEQQVRLLLEREKIKIEHNLKERVAGTCSQLLTQLEELRKQVDAFRAGFIPDLSGEPIKTSSEPATMATAEIPKTSDLLGPVQPTVKVNKDNAEEKEPDWQVEFLPPIDIIKIMNVVNNLDQIPEVEKTEIIPDADKPSVIVFLRKPLQLTETLKTMPEISTIKENTGDIANATTRSVEVALSQDETKQDADILKSDS